MPSARFSSSFPLPARAAQPVAATLAEGERLGVWRITTPLHACDSGRWYLGRHGMAAQEQVLLLVYQEPDEAAAVLLKLADAAGVHDGFRHEALPMPLDSGLTADGHAYVVLPHLDGSALLPACGELPLRQRLQLALQLCDALRDAHEQGLLLRELDPGLLWLVPGHQLRLMGLGLGELAPEPGAMPPMPGGAAALFTSPELRDGAPASLASETYALGMLCSCLANGRLPRPEAGAGGPQLLAALAGVGAAERASLEALLNKAVAEVPQQRHASVRELAEDLRAWLAGAAMSATDPALSPYRSSAPAPLATSARTAPSVDIDIEVVAEAAVPGAEPEPAPRERRGGWRAWLGLGTVLMALLGGWGAHNLSGPTAGQAAIPATTTQATAGE